jgi:hypothetical protein
VKRGRIDDFYGAVERHGGTHEALRAVFRDHPTTPTPWGAAGYLKSEKTGPGLAAHRELIRKELEQPPNLVDVDPRELHATQPSIIREATAHYLGAQWRAGGETFADKGNPGNRNPVVYRRARDGAHLILSGHHRATAALMRGKPLKARLVEGP